MARTADYFKLHFLVFLWGFTAVLGKLVLMPSVEMVFYRTLLAALGMGFWILVTRGTFAVNRRQLLYLGLTGIIIAIHWLTFFGAGRVSNPSTSLVGFATCSLWAALIEPIVKGKKIQLLEIGLGLVVVTGLVIIFSFNFHYKLGLALGIVSGLTAACFSIINSRLVRTLSPYTITFYEMLSAFLVVLLFFPMYMHWISGGQLQLVPSLTDWVYIALMAWVCSVYAFTVSIDLSKRISVFLIQLTLNLEPIYGILLALLIFGQQEVMQFNFYFGTGILLLAVLSYPFLKKSASVSSNGE